MSSASDENLIENRRGKTSILFLISAFGIFCTNIPNILIYMENKAKSSHRVTTYESLQVTF